MRYEGDLYRPPSEAWSYILQATVGCSWNHCTYCAMYREKTFRVRDLEDTLEDVARAGRTLGTRVQKVFVADGDALVLPMDHWVPILEAIRRHFPQGPRVSAYATARNLLDKPAEDLARLRSLGLSVLYVGPESGDDETLRRIAKGADHQAHVEAARRARSAGMDLSCIFLLGAGGVERSEAHARGSAALATAMDPEWLSALTLTVVPGTPQHRLETQGTWTLPDVEGLLGELRLFIDLARPSDALFRTNHASNYLPLAGRLPADRERMLAVLDRALAGKVALRPEWARGL